MSAIPLAACLTMISIFAISKVQAITPANQLGKVMSIIMATAQCIAPIGQVLYGIGFDKFQHMIYVPILITCLLTGLLSILTKYLYRTEPNN